MFLIKLISRPWCCILRMLAGSAITSDAIKLHYKAAALKLHPDKHVHADEATQRRSAERFRRLQLAYETLRDNEKRRAYDRGQLVQ
jgi:DnaJ-class molecular chaperone